VITQALRGLQDWGKLYGGGEDEGKKGGRFHPREAEKLFLRELGKGKRRIGGNGKEWELWNKGS